jgi:alanine-synthesizing transaminase
MRFSNRTPGDISPNPIARALERLKRQPILDLTESNPTHCGFDYPPNLLSSLGSPAALRYEPLPFGLPQARQAVADYLGTKGQRVVPERLVLTSSTSEAYSFLFKLLGDSGSGFLAPTPGYPLLEHLLRLEGMEMIPYPFQTALDWPVELERVRQAVSSACRGLVVVNPHNPTGAFLRSKDQEALGELCEKNQLAYISDEVFADYAYPGLVFKPWAPMNTLSFRLGGLSKALGLPQLKLSWIILDGPTKLLNECQDRLELIADTYLSVNTPVQLALPHLLEFAPNFQKQLFGRILANRGFLKEKLQGISKARLWQAQGGWYALLEVIEKSAKDEKIVLDLLENHEVLVQPGTFYDFPERCFLVLSLLPMPEIFEEGVNRIQNYLRKT